MKDNKLSTFLKKDVKKTFVSAFVPAGDGHLLYRFLLVGRL